MAATIRASTKGLEEVDQARRKKGWSKSEEAWAGLALTSVATLRRFCAGIPIQTRTFQEICKAVEITDWESIADFERIDETSSKVYSKRLCFAIAGSIEDIDKNKLDAIVALLQKLGGDTTIEILDIDEGSIKLILGGSPEALEKIESLFKSGEAFGSSVQDVHFLEKNELIWLISKNGGTALNLSGLDLRGADLYGADLCHAHLRETDLRYAHLSHADLIGADLSHAHLIGSYLSHADLSHADLSHADLSHADLYSSNLSHTNLSHTNLRHAHLSISNLSHADLSHADLSISNLSISNLSHAILRGANLSHAILPGANLSEADLYYANLIGADLSETKLTNARFSNNAGFSDTDKADMKERGALFEDSPESDVPSFVKR
jgi:uncharacterized protein YjbI with pentapeptide repeats